jgi:acetyl-CoA C-acetyltransferase
MDDSRTPILVGCGQITQREADPAAALSPMELTVSAAKQAARDTGAGDGLLADLDTVLSIRSFSDTSWRFASPFGQSTNVPKTLAARIGAGGASCAKRLIYTYPGGNMVNGPSTACSR